jgi:hypothetical protein
MRRAAGALMASILAVSFASSGVSRGDPKDVCMAAAERSQPLLRDGKLVAGREELLACSKPDCPAFVRGDCAKWLADVDSRLPSIIIRAIDANGSDVANVRVSVDGVVVAQGLDGRMMPMDPGPHTLHYEAAGYVPVEDHVVIRETEKGRELTVKFVTKVAASPGPESTAAPPGPGVPVFPLVLMGVGVVGMGVGVGFWVAGLSSRSNMESTCAPKGLCTTSQVSSSQNQLRVGDVVAGVGLVAAAAGVVLFFTSRGSSSPPPVDVQTTPGGAVLSWGGAF